MKHNPISTLHRTIAFVLLFSQLLPSCGGAEFILPRASHPTQENIGLSDDNPISESSIGAPTHLAMLNEQGYESDDSSQPFTTPTYTTRKGHQIQLIQEGGQYIARVQEQLPPGFSSAPYTLPVRFQKDFFPEDLTPDSYVDVVFPRQANDNKGYVFCAEYKGLLGGMFRDKNGRPFGSDPSVWDLHNHRCNKDTRQSASSSSTPWSSRPTASYDPLAPSGPFIPEQRISEKSSYQIAEEKVAGISEQITRMRSKMFAELVEKDRINLVEEQAKKAAKAEQKRLKKASQELLDPYLEKKLETILIGEEDDISGLIGISMSLQRPLYIYDAEGELYDKIGEDRKKPLIKGEPFIEPIRLQHIVNPDGSGHWKPYSTTYAATSTCNSKCMYDACVVQLSELEKQKLDVYSSDDLREKTVDTLRENPGRATEIFQTADRLNCIRPDAPRIGGNRYRIDAGKQRHSNASQAQNSTNKQLEDIVTAVEKYLDEDLNTPASKAKAIDFLKNLKKLAETIQQGIKTKEATVNTATMVGSPRSKQAGNIKEPVAATEKEIAEQQEQLERLEELKESLLLNTNLNKEELKVCGIVRDSSKGLVQSIEIDMDLDFEALFNEERSEQKLRSQLEDYLAQCKTDTTYQQLLDELALSITKSEAVPGSILLAADREVKEQALREHPCYQEGISLALQAAYHRNRFEKSANNMLTSEDYKPLTAGILGASKKLQARADRIKEELLQPLREVFEAPSTPRGSDKAKAFFSGMGESVKDTLELPLVLGKFGITAAQSVIEWEDKLGLKSTQEAIQALLTQAKHDWENPAAYEARAKVAKAYQAKMQAYEKAFNAQHYHTDQAKTAGYISAEVLQFVLGSEIFKANAQSVKAAGRACIPKNIHIGKQGKHIIGHNNYCLSKGRSILTVDPNILIKDFHSGKFKKLRTVYNKIVVDFENTIGTYYSEGKEIGPTRFGIIHVQKDGVHIVPANPNQLC